MRNILVSTLAVAALAGCAPSGTTASSSGDGGASLERALAGRTAEAPVSCVNLQQLDGNKGYPDGSIVFEGKNRSIVYVNRPAGGCPGLSSFRALRTKTTSSQLCSGDIITIFDPSSGIEYGSCGLGQFTPYRRQ